MREFLTICATEPTGAANVLDSGAGRDSIRIIHHNLQSALVLTVTGAPAMVAADIEILCPRLPRLHEGGGEAIGP